jgi:hypothetical protein
MILESARRLDDEREVPDLGSVQDLEEAFHPDAALTDVFVSIPSGSSFVLRIVRVDEDEPIVQAARL